MNNNMIMINRIRDELPALQNDRMAEILRGIQEEKRNNHVEGNSKKLGIAIRKSVLMKTA